jgi:ferrochelatase
VICPIAFVSEHVETLVELDRDYKNHAESRGCAAFVRAPALGVEPSFIAGLAQIVIGALARPGGPAPGSAFTCPSRWSKCPARRAA